MQIDGKNVLVTGAGRGLGAEFTRQLVARGARVYAGARTPLDGAPGVTPLELDITDPVSVSAAVRVAADVDVVVNNAGLVRFTNLVDGDLEAIRAEMETNFFGPLGLTRAFAPSLRANGGGAVVNVVSAMSWFTLPGGSAYAASKAAAWSLTDSARLELAGQGTHVVGVYMGLVDTDMTAGTEAPKISPAALAGAGLDAVESGLQEVLGDDWASFVKSGLHLDPGTRYERILTALGA